MEDPSVDWQMQEYSSEENSDKVSWILNQGLKLGKRILVTGFVISSAPLVLPPLVVISSIGFACSIPYGLLLASYACTEKLMDKLLPRPTHAPLLLEFGTVSSDDEEVNSDENEEDDKPLEITKGVLIEGMGGGEEEEHAIKESKDEQPVEEVISRVVIGIEVDDNNGSSTINKEETPLEVTSIVVEDVELVRETRGLLELIRDEDKSKTNNVVEKDRQSVEKMYGGAEEKNQEIVRHGEEIGIPIEDRNVCGNVRMEKLIKEIEQKVEHRNRETPKKSKKRQKMGYRKNVDTVPYEIKPSAEIEELSEKKDIDSVLQTDKPEPETCGTINVGSIAEADQKPVIDKAAMLKGESAKANVSNYIKHDFHLNREKEIVIASKADAREIADESFDDKNEAGEHESRIAAISSGKDISMASKKVLYNEEKIWEQIDAMRIIVGYKATPHASCIEELKALYLFTGVEPPASFKDPSDLVEVSDKLRFLMSINCWSKVALWFVVDVILDVSYNLFIFLKVLSMLKT